MPACMLITCDRDRGRVSTVACRVGGAAVVGSGRVGIWQCRGLPAGNGGAWRFRTVGGQLVASLPRDGREALAVRRPWRPGPAELISTTERGMLFAAMAGYTLEELLTGGALWTWERWWS